MFAAVTDETLTEATGISGAAIRKLVDHGLLAPENPGERGRGNHRMWADETVSKAAMIVALCKVGMSLLEAVAVLSVGGWRSDERLSVVSAVGEDNGINKLLKSRPAPRRDDVVVEIVDGHFIFERSELIAQMSGDGRVLTTKQRAPESVRKQMPNIAVGKLAAAIADKHTPVSKTAVNLSLAVREATRRVLTLQGFVAA